MAKTIGFYQNFNLDLKRLSAALRCVETQPELGHDALATCMAVNRPVAEGFSAWLRHTGLATLGEQRQRGRRYELTPFGKLAFKYDPNLTDLGTQWVLHYYLSTKHTECSQAWRVLMNEFLSPGLNFTAEQFTSYFASVMGDEVKNRSALKKDPSTAISTTARMTQFAEAIIKIQNYLNNQPRRTNKSYNNSSYQGQSPRMQPLTEEGLATRLGVSVETVRKERINLHPPLFVAWCKGKDRSGMGWEFNPDTELYHPVS